MYMGLRDALLKIEDKSLDSRLFIQTGILTAPNNFQSVDWMHFKAPFQAPSKLNESPFNQVDGSL
jgi:hypothetical protein